MVICRNCLIPMVETMSFQPGERNRHDRYCKCPKCKGEYMNKEIQKAGRRND